MQFHHLHKKTHRKHLRIPLSHKKHAVVDALAFSAGIASPVMTLPQIVLIFTQKTSAGVSLTTWSCYVLFSLIWLFYGVVHKEKAVLVSGILGLFVDGAVVMGALRY